jgi:hypothetical protein
METEQFTGLSTMEVIQTALGGPLQAGQMGIIMARAGVGKTASLTHVALEQLLRGVPVLHVCLNEVPEKIKLWYLEFLRNIAASQPELELAGLQQRIEPLRFILAYLHQTFTPDKLEQSLRNLKEQAKFSPALVVIDGMDFDRLDRSTIEALSELAGKREVSMWMSARTHRHISIANDHGIPYPCNDMDDLFAAILLLEPASNGIELKVLKHIDVYQPGYAPILLNTDTYMLQLDKVG